MKLKRGIDKAVVDVVEELRNQSQPVGDSLDSIRQVGTISANGDEEIGSYIAEAMEKVGKDGVITVEEAKGTDTYLDTVEGMQFDRGYLSPYFVTNSDNMNAEIEEPYYLNFDKKKSNIINLFIIH